MQRLARALPARSEAPGRWTGPLVQADGPVDALPAHKVHQAAKVGTSGAGGSLPHLDKIQRAFGKHDVTHVVAHTDWAAKKGSEAMGARAFTTGNHVAFAGTPTLHTAAHEAAHVVQQQQGVQLKGGVGRVGDPYEEHADAVADAVVSGKSAEALLAPFAKGGSGGGGAVQRDVDVGTKYTRPVITAPQPRTWGTGQASDDQVFTQYTPDEQKEIDRNSRVLERPTAFYRWGRYENEKHYVANHGFNLRTVNQGATQHGRGLYLADTPYGSTQYSGESDYSIIKVTVPRGTRICSGYKTSFVSKIEQEAIRSPDMLDIGRSWYVLKNDRLRLQVEFYRATDQELSDATFKKGFRGAVDSGNLRGLYALQIILRQAGKPIRTPANLQTLLANRPARVTKRVTDYIAALTRYEYVPFMMSARGLGFSDGYAAFRQSLNTTKRYRKYFGGSLHTALQRWDADPFATDVDQFKSQITEPFAKALTAYEADRKENLTAEKVEQTGAKLTESRIFRNRLYSFRKFLRASDGSANQLAGSLGLGSSLGPSS
ncbi:MAG: DUF4157 domain-containing protein [Polyangia bacterium]